MCDVREPLLVVLADLLPVKPMHIPRVEEVTISSPNLVEDLVPFLHRVDLGRHSRGRNGLARTLALRVRIENSEAALSSRDQFGSVSGESIVPRRRCDRRLFAVL